MPSVTKIKVVLNGSPLAGVSVLLGECGQVEKVTDANGIVAFPKIEAPWTGYVEVLMMGGVIQTATANVKLVAGETTTINLGEIEQP